MEEMKKDEALEEQQTTAEAAEAAEAEAVQAEESRCRVLTMSRN